MESKKEGNFLLHSPERKKKKRQKKMKYWENCLARRANNSLSFSLSTQKKLCVYPYIFIITLLSSTKKKNCFFFIFSMRLRSRPNLEWKTISSYFSQRVLIILSFSLDTTTAHIFEHSTRESWKFIPKKYTKKKKSSSRKRRSKKIHCVYTFFPSDTLRMYLNVWITNTCVVSTV